MKTIDEIMTYLIGKGVIADLADLLRANDEEFVESEKQYLQAVEQLRKLLPADQTPTLDEYLSACDSHVISDVVYAGYLGFKVNLENFHHPIGINFVRMDTIDYLKGHLFGHFPVNYQIAHIRDDFYRSLSEEAQRLHDDIQYYYIHLECDGPKLAHYAGYIIGNHLLPWVEPG